jgi:hypothetical protein
MRLVAKMLAALFAVALAAVPACSTQPDLCAPGRSVACACPGNKTGAQTCLPDGMGYDACVCTEKSSATSAAATTSTGPGMVLMAGDYNPTSATFPDDSCGGYTAHLQFLKTTLTWSAPEKFALSGASGITIPCTIGATSITCLGFTDPFSPDANTNLTLKSQGGTIVVNSTTSFSLTETVDVSCQGPGCGYYSTEVNAGFPCSYTVEITYVHA